jgi:hypothetical protein
MPLTTLEKSWHFHTIVRVSSLVTELLNGMCRSRRLMMSSGFAIGAHCILSTAASFLQPHHH